MPTCFYHRIRPFLTGWPEPGLVYERVDETPRLLTGGSAAQSSLIQAFDAGLRIPHQHEVTGAFLRAMRAYMPLSHRRFLADLEAGPSIFDYVTARRGEHPRLVDAYNACVRAVGDLRAQHLGLTGRYISRFERNGDRAKARAGPISQRCWSSLAKKPWHENWDKRHQPTAGHDAPFGPGPAASVVTGPRPARTMSSRGGPIQNMRRSTVADDANVATSDGGCPAVDHMGYVDPQVTVDGFLCPTGKPVGMPDPLCGSAMPAGWTSRPCLTWAVPYGHGTRRTRLQVYLLPTVTCLSLSLVVDYSH
ncbi:indoleamine 2,3-dioxygenase [Micromonospora sp. CPCC 205371]|nr:indoleamine 2,3-dioxygenase [Micromonospora sp. CPCC 205371]